MNKCDSYFEANRGVMSDFLPTSYDRVLEIGCASGGFSKYLTSAQEIWGVEPNQDAANRAATRMTRVLCGRYDQIENSLPDQYFDLVVCNDVIEHMVDHEAFFLDIRRKIKPGAYLVGSLPNVRHVTALFKLVVLKDWPYAESGILDRTHLRFFTERSILRFFHEQNVSVEKFSGVGSVIRHGLCRPDNPLSPLKSLIFRAGVASIVLGTMGYYWDTQYPQYGFRIRF